MYLGWGVDIAGPGSILWEHGQLIFGGVGIFGLRGYVNDWRLAQKKNLQISDLQRLVSLVYRYMYLLEPHIATTDHYM